MNRNDHKTQTQVYIRKFLNKPRNETHAFILADCTAYGPRPWTNKKNKKTGVYPPQYDGYLTIGDCSRTITLDLHISDHSSQNFKGKMSPSLRKDYNNVHHKATQLMLALAQIVDQIEAWHERNFPEELSKFERRKLERDKELGRK